MNGIQQKEHRTVTARIAADVEEIAEAAASRMLALENGSRQLDRTLRDLIGDERTHRLKLADEQRSYVDAEDRTLRQCCQERWDETAKTTKRLADAHFGFARRGFWSRMNWIFTGR